VIRAAARHLLGGPYVPPGLARSIPGDVAEQLATPELRELTLNIASILCFADVTVAADGSQAFLDPARVTVVDDLARYLGVGQRDVVELRRLTKHHRDHVAFDLFRRFLVGTYGGEMTAVHTALLQSETRLHIDARRVHELWEQIELLPDGTVGAELIRYYHENGWSYPGTDHHQPLAFAEHDFHHVLGGYSTTPAGELQVGAFTAGVAARPMDCVLFFLMWEQLGIGSPAIPGAVGSFDPEPFFAALERGSRTTRDFIGETWDPWSIVGRDLTELREQYEIGAGAQLAPGEPYNRDPERVTS
jgi:hypothetical protein